PHPPPAHADRLGQERQDLPRRRRLPLQARPARRGVSPLRHRAFRAGGQGRRDRSPDLRFPCAEGRTDVKDVIEPSAASVSDEAVSKDPVYSSDVAFTPTVKAIQARKGSRRGYASMEQRGSWAARISFDLAAFIESQTSVFLGTANKSGQPYIQHRGGPPGFLKVLDDRTIGFADFTGNRQYITQGNLCENPKGFLFLIDYGARQRVKIWGEAHVIEDDP